MIKTTIDLNHHLLAGGFVFTTNLPVKPTISTSFQRSHHSIIFYLCNLSEVVRHKFNYKKMTKKVLVTGAGGFIGGFIVEEALKRGYDVWAAVRATTSRKYLTDSRIHFIELDFTDADKLTAALRTEVEEQGKWDYIVHNLGATKCANFADFNTINHEYLKRFIEALRTIDAVPEGFLMMSTMGVMGVGDEKNYTPFNERMIPMPNTKYGLSKLKSETYLQMQSDIPYIAFRPTGVYGPRESDYYLMIKSIAKGFDFSVGFRRQTLTFIYVKDLVAAVFDALESGVRRKSYLIADNGIYSQKEFRNIVKSLLGKKFVLPVIVPIWMLKIACTIAEKVAVAQMKVSTLNRDKFKIMKQRNWTCDTSLAKSDFGFHPKYSLEEGLKETIDWYKTNGWL